MDIQVLRPFSANGIFFQDFQHFIVASPGVLAVLPWVAGEGKCTPAVEGCPVSFSEVLELIQFDAAYPLNFNRCDFNKNTIRLLLQIDDCGWQFGRIERLKAWGFTHFSGLRVAFAKERLEHAV